MTQDPALQTERLVVKLREAGHDAEADHLAKQLDEHPVEHGLLFALREACETVLTGIEAIDPSIQPMIENLRVTVEKRLGMPLNRPE